MKFHIGITLKKLFEEYNLPVPQELTSEILEEPLSAYGETLISDLQEAKQEMDAKIASYLSSEQFIADAIQATKELAKRQDFPADFWLQIKYTKEKNICIRVDMDMKEC